LYFARHTEFIVHRCFFPNALLFLALFEIMNVAFVLSAIGANLVWPIAVYSSLAFARAVVRRQEFLLLPQRPESAALIRTSSALTPIVDLIWSNLRKRPEAPPFSRGRDRRDLPHSGDRSSSQNVKTAGIKTFGIYSCLCNESSSARQVSLNSLNGSWPFTALI
jgi:hypothetical protein